MLSLSLRDGMIIGGLLFNAGLTIGGGLYLFRNHMAHVAKSLASIKNILCNSETGVVVKLARLDEKVANLERK